jgi:hypothetical protein
MTTFKLKKNVNETVNVYPTAAPGEQACEIPYFGTLHRKEGTRKSFNAEYELHDDEGNVIVAFDALDVESTGIQTGEKILNIRLKYKG